MSDKFDPAGAPATLLRLFPQFLCLDLLAEPSFQELVGLPVERTISLGGSLVRFSEKDLYAAVRALYCAPEKTGAVEDSNGVRWALSLLDIDDRPALQLSAGEDLYNISEIGGLNADREQRVLYLDRALNAVGLPPTALPAWRSILESRVLMDAEVSRLNSDLSLTPECVGRDIATEAQAGSLEVETMVPTEVAYYERLCGGGSPMSIGEMAESSIQKHVADLLSWSVEGGVRAALLLAWHPLIIPNSSLEVVPKEIQEKIALWARDEGELSAKIGVIELGLSQPEILPHIAPILEDLVVQVCSLESDGGRERLQLFAAAFVLCAGVLSQTGVLSEWPPFRRRLAALAQASLIERKLFGRIDVDGFEKWAFARAGRRYYLQSLVDLREEPRWLPDYIGAPQLAAEILGRVSNVANRYAEYIPEGRLRTLLLGGDPECIPAHLRIPHSFLPGPLEGGLSGTGNSLPFELAKSLDQGLSGKGPEPTILNMLINLCGLFAVDETRILRATELIRNSNHRLSDDLETERRNALVLGLASVAASSRNVSLADELRVMVRRNRIDNLNPPGPSEELFIALTAGASRSEKESWAEFVGDWAIELASTVNDRRLASELLGSFEDLCEIEPALRRRFGRAIAGVRSYLLV